MENSDNYLCLVYKTSKLLISLQCLYRFFVYGLIAEATFKDVRPRATLVKNLLKDEAV